MQLFFGQASLRGDFSRYLSRGFNLLEVTARPQQLPKVQKLRDWQRTAPDDFRFSLVIDPDAFGAPDAAASKQAIEYSLKIAEALQPRFVVLRPPSSFRPVPSSERRLSTMVEMLRDAGCGDLAWEPGGLWQSQNARGVAERLDLVLVQRPEDFVPEATSYLRLVQLGVGRDRLSHGAFELAASLADCSEAYLVLEGDGAQRIHKELRSALLDLAAPEDDAEAASAPASEEET